MKTRDRIMAVLHHERPDIIPFTVYAGFISKGSRERELRNMGLGLADWETSVYGVRTHKVTMETIQHSASYVLDERICCIPKHKDTVDRTYRTPGGSVSEKCKLGYASIEWPVEWVLKNRSDYEIIRFIIDDTEYFPNYEEFLKAQESMGDDGIVFATAPKSPMQSMLLEIMGYRQFFMEFYTNKKEFEELHDMISRKQLEMYNIIAESPAEVVMLDDNINGTVTSPSLFETYVAPFYDKVEQILHRRDKIFMVHMDGKLKCLRDLVAKTRIDVIEAFTPPPMGDLSIEEARAAWNNKVIWANFPGAVALSPELDKVEKETMNILRSAAPGDNFILGVTEDIGDVKSSRFIDILRTIMSTVMKHGRYPVPNSDGTIKA